MHGLTFETIKLHNKISRFILAYNKMDWFPHLYHFVNLDRQNKDPQKAYTA